MKPQFLLFIQFILILSVKSFSQIIKIDSTFGTNGISMLDIVPLESYASIAVQSDGKTIAVGTAEDYQANSKTIIVTRHTINGELDSTFGINGITQIYNNGAYYYGNSIVINKSGKIFVLSSAALSVNQFTLLHCLNKDGSLDSSFGINGMAKLGNFTSGSTAALDASNKIIIGGCYSTSINSFNIDSDFLLARFDSTGKLDSSFGSNGIVITPFSIGSSKINALALQSDQKIIAAGYSKKNSYHEGLFTLVRYNSDGSLDSTFGSNGIVIELLPQKFYFANAKCVTIQNDGKILTGGYAMEDYSYNYKMYAHLLRYNSDGSIDSSFGTNGSILFLNKANLNPSFNSLILWPNGKIIAIGQSNDTIYNPNNYYIINYNFMLVGFTGNGDLDANFGNGGILTNDLNTISADICNAACQISPTEFITAGSTNHLDNNSFDGDFVLVKYIVSLTTGIIDFTSSSKHFLVYPNPVKGTETLQYELLQEEEISINLFDMQGRLAQPILIKQKRTAGKHSEQFTISDNLSSGSYLLSIESAKGKTIIKIIK